MRQPQDHGMCVSDAWLWLHLHAPSEKSVEVGVPGCILIRINVQDVLRGASVRVGGYRLVADFACQLVHDVEPVQSQA